MSEPADRKTTQRRNHVPDAWRVLPTLDSANITVSPINKNMVYSHDSEKRTKKKERARRNLVDTLSAKRPTTVSITRGVTYSYSDRKTPLVTRQSGPAISVRKKDVIGLQYDSGDRCVTRTDPDFEESLEIPDSIIDHHSRLCRSSSHRRSDTNLPQLIHDLNSSIKYQHKRTDDSSDTSCEDVVYNGEDVMQSLSQLWDRSRRSKDDHNKPWLQYRPITPNLLDKLDRLKVSSRTRTEQWVKQIPAEKRSYHSPLYRLGNVSKDDSVSSPPVYESWIYEETRRSAHGRRKPRQT